MYIRTALAALAVSFTASATPASAHYSGCTYLNGGFCEKAHYIRHHSAQARHNSPWAPSVGSAGNPYNEYWYGGYWPAYPTYPVNTYPTYPINTYPSWPTSNCNVAPNTTYCPY